MHGNCSWLFEWARMGVALTSVNFWFSTVWCSSSVVMELVCGNITNAYTCQWSVMPV